MTKEYGRTFSTINDSKMNDASRSSENPLPSMKYQKARTTVLLDYNMKDNYMRKENERKKKLQA